MLPEPANSRVGAKPLRPAVELVMTMAPLALLDHGGDGGLASMEGAGEHVNGVVEGLRLPTWLTRNGQDVGVDDHEIDTTKLCDTLGHDRRSGTEIADVCLACHDPATGLAHQPHSLFQIPWHRQWVLDGRHILAEIQGDDVGTFLGHHHRVRTPLTPRSSSDERHLGVKSAHAALLQTTIWLVDRLS
jgi:hypothetical protein